MQFTNASKPHEDDIKPAANIISTIVPTEKHAEAYVHHCANTIVSYSLTGTFPFSSCFSISSKTGLDATLPMQARYSEEHFQWILVDPGWSIINIGGLSQYKAYCAFVGDSTSIDESRQASVILGDVRHRAIGMARIRFPLGPTFCAFDIYLVDFFLPLLLSLADMDRMKVFTPTSETVWPPPQYKTIRRPPKIRLGKRVTGHLTIVARYRTPLCTLPAIRSSTAALQVRYQGRH